MNAETHSQLASFIWSICNLLRGPYKRNEYRKVILPLTVLRRFDCLLAPSKQEVLKKHAEIKGKPDSVVRSLLQKVTGRPFYNLSKLDFEKLLDDPNQLAPNLNGYISKFSPNVRGIMDKFAFDQQIARMAEKNLLFEVIKAFAKVDLSPERVDNVQMGYVFEELIRVGAEQSNEEAGEHFTPREVIKLMVNLLLSPEKDLRRSHVVKTIYDPACGTGGMLSVSEKYIRDLNADAQPMLYGQDWNDEAWAVCKSDMLIKGEDADNICPEDTFTKDGFDRDEKGKKYTFDYMLANPPFGVEWKQQATFIEKEHATLGYDGRFGAGLPRINDGSLLFLQHMLSKMRAPKDGGSRIGIVFNGSPLFTGDAGSGESNIRQWIIENDWLEAVVALPDQLFYNTGISTYIWVLTNRKERQRKGKVQLIDARQFYVKMRKSLGNKRNKLGDKDEGEPDQIGEVSRMRYSAYLSYKPSGIEWLGPVPEHWEVKPLKHALSEIVSGGTPDVFNDQYWAYGDEPGLNWVAIADMTRNVRVQTTDRRITNAGRASKDLRVLPPGVLLYSMYASLGKVAILEIPAAFNQAILGLYPADRKLERNYLRFWLNSMEPRLELFSSSNTQDNLNAAKVRQMPLFVPPLDEQRVIDNFLDYEIAKLDTLVEKKRALVEKLKEKRTALISRTVTRGLPPDAARAAGLNPYPKLKSSGIEWHGDVPSHWNVVRLRFLVEGIVDTEHKTVEFDPDGDYLVARTTNIRGGSLIFNDAKYTNEDGFREWTRRGAPQPGEILFTREAPAGEACIVPSSPRLCLGQRVVLLRVKQNALNSSFAIYSIYGGLAHEFIEAMSAGSTVPHFNMSDISSIPFLVPPIDEQCVIADYLDRETAKIERMLNKVEAAIERLQEYRAALITAAVTGKIDVRSETTDNKMRK